MAIAPSGLSLSTRGRLQPSGLSLSTLGRLASGAAVFVDPDPTCHFESTTGNDGALTATSAHTGRMSTSTANRGRTGATTTC